jgi:hypothetical protein
VGLDDRLDRLHLTLQAAMGWANTHLYVFEADSATWGAPDPDFGSDDLPSNKATLADVLEDTGAHSIRYIYDFGDNWDLKLQVGKITDPIPGNLYPCLIDAAGQCPPEDVGGIPGYEEFLQAMADPEHAEHQHLKEWFGGSFDPGTPPVDELRFEVLKLAKRWKPTKR